MISEREFYERYSDMPLVQPIEVLDLILKKEEADRIMRGEKIFEFREYKEFYASRLLSKEMMDYADKKIDEDDYDFIEGYYEYASPLKQVETIHFHNYNKTWHVDVDISENGLMPLDESAIEYLHSFGCHELDESYENVKDDADPPQFFFFKIDGIIEGVESV